MHYINIKHTDVLIHSDVPRVAEFLSISNINAHIFSLSGDNEYADAQLINVTVSTRSKELHNEAKW